MALQDVQDLSSRIENLVVELLRLSATKLPEDMYKVLATSKEKETDERATLQLSNIVEDATLAKNWKAPICQDTGIVLYDLKVGDEFPLKSQLKSLLIEATKRATKEVPLRPNAIDIFEGNTKNNVGLRGFVPYFYIDLVPGSDLEIEVINKGGGSSNIARLGMLKPGVGLKGVMKFVVDSVVEAGPQGCPPYRVGVGIGGGEDIAMILAKKALFRPIGQRHPDPRVAKLEETLLNAINEVKIGPMGVGAGVTAVDVNINLAARHPASLPVGVVFSCWALRYAKAIVHADGTYEIANI